MLSGKARWNEIMAGPISRQEVSQMETRLLEKVMSTALAIEAIETLLIRKGLFKDDEVMAEIGELVKKTDEQAKAAEATPKIVEVS